MADLSKNLKYLKAIFNVWYDPKNDNIHVTTQDSDFGPNGVHITAKVGTASDANLRSGLASHGCPHDPTSSEAFARQQAARDAFLALSPDERSAFLKSATAVSASKKKSIAALTGKPLDEIVTGSLS